MAGESSMIKSMSLAEKDEKPRVITPFPAPKLMDLPMFQGEHKENLYWGTYRPQAYFGIRARNPQPLVAGLMWLVPKDGKHEMRHLCGNFDDIKSFGWREHNGIDFGRQELLEQDMILETSFVKSKEESLGYGGDWAVRINVQNIVGVNDEVKRGAHLFFYVADEGDNVLNLGLKESSVLASGSRDDVGNWQLHMKSETHLETHYCGLKSPGTVHLSGLVQKNISIEESNSGRLELSNTTEDSSNVYVFQISTMTQSTIDIAFVSGLKEETSNMEKRIMSLTGSPLSSLLEKKRIAFDTKFKECFNLSEKVDSETLMVGKAAIGNMLGGIGYFYGQSKVYSPKSEDDFFYYWPAELYTAVPCRPKFSWGFLWDEGFHQMLIWRWDFRITLEIVGHWLDLMNIDGWIPREQLLGAEALSKISKEYIIQNPRIANPPTLLLVICALINGIHTNKFKEEEIIEIFSFLERAFVRLDAWFKWYCTSQKGKEKRSYYWHDRDSKTIKELNPQGLDDYPRASHPSEDERHVDLRCWMYLAADCMNSITKFLGKKTTEDYSSTAKLLSEFNLLNEMHYDYDHGTYLDFGNHTEKVQLVRKEVTEKDGRLSLELVRETFGEPKLRMVPHIGYVSFFPFMFKIIPHDSPILEKQLDLISDRSKVWSDYGLLSLAKTSSIYMKHNAENQAPYWRGPIWMNMNYMILSSLHHYSKDGPYSDKARTIYEELRSNLIRNVVKNYDQTGYIWEHYDQTNGNGEGGRMFTGWSALILLIMSEEYPTL